MKTLYTYCLNVRSFFNCSSCASSFASKKALNSHLRDVHPNGLSTCRECHQTFSSFETLSYHTLARHVQPTTPFYCNHVHDCGHSFSTRSKATLHFCYCHKLLPQQRSRHAKGPYATKDKRAKRKFKQDLNRRDFKRIRIETPVEQNMLRRLAKLPANALKKCNDKSLGTSRAKSK